MALKGQEIAVLGAGIAGLATATALARRGARVRVFEQAEALGEVGAGVQISPNGVAVLEALGLREQAAALANTPEAVVLRDYPGTELVRLPMGAAAERRYGRPYWQFHRADLLAVLQEGAQVAGVQLILGHRLESVARAGAGLRMGFANGAEAGAAALIGADGVRSSLRALAFGGQPARFTGQVAWRGLVPAARLPEGLFENAAQVFMGKGRHFVVYPLRGGRVINFVAVEERPGWADEGWNIPDDVANLRKAFKDFAPPVQALLEAVDETFLWGLFNHPVLPRWAKGRMALVGDACHPMLPFLAQGATMGLEDAHVLAAKMDALGIEPGLQAYETTRKPRATRVQRAALRNAWSYHLRLPLFRQAAHRILAHLPQKALLGQFDYLYGHDVTETGQGAPC